jgi:toxin FitB
MYLVDTNVLSERRKGRKADPGVLEFFRRTKNEVFVPVQVAGEILGGIERLRQRGDYPQALLVQQWFQSVLEEFAQHFLIFDLDCAQFWGILVGISEQHKVDKQIAAIALVHDLTVVTRNIAHFSGTGVRVLNPFVGDSNPTPVN